MIEGKEPMRTFGDLMQFMKVKDAPEPTEQPKPKKSEAAETLAQPNVEASVATSALPAAGPDESRPVPSGAVPPPHPVPHAESSEHHAGQAQTGEAPAHTP
jgi:hypothetical protein